MALELDEDQTLVERGALSQEKRSLYSFFEVSSSVD
jgi:hypothetical protein